MISMGIDLSINSTGICIYKEDSVKYYLIVSHSTSKMRSNNDESIEIINYIKTDDKDTNIYRIIEIILYIINIESPELIVIEDVAIGAKNSRSLIDLTGLNYGLRSLLIHNRIPYKCTPPSNWKRQMLGNGQANKEQIIFMWKKMNKDIPDLKKLDDLADAFFLSLYGKTLSM